MQKATTQQPRGKDSEVLTAWAKDLAGGNTKTIRELGLRRGSKADGLVESSRILVFGTAVMHE